ncbi:MAG: hypothetical protein ACRDQ5_02235 [Sciscionella sp.]
MSAEAIYKNFKKDAIGTGSLGDGGDASWDAHNELPERAVRIQRLANKIESYWEGDAAGGAQRGLGPIVLDLMAAALDHDAAQDSIYRQSHAFARARDSVREVPPEPQLTDVAAQGHAGSLVGGVIAMMSMEHKAKQRNDAAAHNVQVYETYRISSTDNADRIPAKINTLYSDNAPMSVATPRGHQTTPHTGGCGPSVAAPQRGSDGTTHATGGHETK